ncbi:MAG: DUF898 family protein [Deinococcales bacterium]
MLYHQARYHYENFSYGNTRSSYDGLSKAFYQRTLWWALPPIALFIIFVALNPLAFVGIIGSPTGIIAFYAVYGILFLTIQQIIQTSLFNYNLNNWAMFYAHHSQEKISFKSHLKIMDMLGLRFSNLLAIIFSLGLLIPWAKVRYTRYLFDHIEIDAPEGFEEIERGAHQRDGLLGDVASDVFDLDAGFDMGF